MPSLAGKSGQNKETPREGDAKRKKYQRDAKRKRHQKKEAARGRAGTTKGGQGKGEARKRDGKLHDTEDLQKEVPGDRDAKKRRH